MARRAAPSAVGQWSSRFVVTRPRAMRRPCPSSPSRFSEGTKQSWRTTSLSMFWPDRGVLPGVTRQPGESRSTKNAQYRSSEESRRATRIEKSAKVPPVLNTLCPVTR